jgi:thymidylate synthase ThyX
MSFSAKVILDSLAPNGKRLTTMEVQFPRFILAEFNTHRMFSRNSASSRAMPVEKIIQRVMDDPFIPEKFPVNHKGMQAQEYYAVDSIEHDIAKSRWLFARNAAVYNAKVLIGKEAHIDDAFVCEDKYGIAIGVKQQYINVHKQIANRLLEPFMWHTVIVSATEWANFFHLRCSPLAQPEMQRTADCMKIAYDMSYPTPLKEADWHMPYIRKEDWDFQSVPIEYDEDFDSIEDMLKAVSAARCCRVSYLTHEGKRSIAADLELYEKLRTADPMHASPFEHVAQAMSANDAETPSGNFYGWRQWRKSFHGENYT